MCWKIWNGVIYDRLMYECKQNLEDKLPTIWTILNLCKSFVYFSQSTFITLGYSFALLLTFTILQKLLILPLLELLFRKQRPHFEVIRWLVWSSFQWFQSLRPNCGNGWNNLYIPLLPGLSFRSTSHSCF